jgi:hypothetical protein
VSVRHNRAARLVRWLRLGFHDREMDLGAEEILADDMGAAGTAAAGA